MPGALLVPASRHERDAYTAIAGALAERGVASLRIDVRGRGTQPRRDVLRPDDAAPAPTRRARRGRRVRPARRGERRRSATGSPSLPSRTPPPTRLIAVGGRPFAGGGRPALGPGAAAAAPDAVGRRQVPVFGLVSKEDRDGLRATVDAYLAAAPGTSRLEVFDGLGFGTTMLSSAPVRAPRRRAARGDDRRLAGRTAHVSVPRRTVRRSDDNLAAAPHSSNWAANLGFRAEAAQMAGASARARALTMCRRRSRTRSQISTRYVA